MEKKTKIIFLFILLLIVVSATYSLKPKTSFEKKRELILKDLSAAIEEAKAQGKYNCCIEPPCTMCYLGDWIWKDGSCHCGEMIIKGEFDKVCPQCKKGLEEGLCKSTETEQCDIESGENFKPAN